MSDTRAANQIFNFVFLPQYFLAGLISPINVLPWYLAVLSFLSPMRYVIDLARGVVYAGTPEFGRVVLLSPATNVAVLGTMFVVLVVAGTALFVRRETSREEGGVRPARLISVGLHQLRTVDHRPTMPCRGLPSNGCAPDLMP